MEIQPSYEMNLSYNLDPIVLESMKDLLDSTTLAKFQNPNNVIRYMNKKMELLKHSDAILNEDDRMIGLVAHSVGMESAKQWAEVLNDPTNPFHLLKEKNHDRKLQLPNNINLMNNIDFSDDEIQTKFVNVLQADILGSATGAINSVFESNKDKSMLDFAVEEASISSLKSFSDNFITLGIGLSNEMNECNFPNAFWCNSNAGNGLSENLNNNMQNISDMSGGGGGAGCLFPGSPLCNQSQNNNDENTDFNDSNENGNGGMGGGIMDLANAIVGSTAGNGEEESNINNNVSNGNGGTGGGILGLAGALSEGAGGAPGNGEEGSNQSIGNGNGGVAGGGILGLAGALAGGAAVANNGGIGNGGFGGGGLLDPCANPDSPLCEISENVIGNMNNNGDNFGISGSGVTNQDGWDEDDDKWIDTNSIDLNDPAYLDDPDDCPFPNSPKCKSNTFTTDDGIEIHCAIPTSPLCQLARKRLKLPSTSTKEIRDNP